MAEKFKVGDKVRFTEEAKRADARINWGITFPKSATVTELIESYGCVRLSVNGTPLEHRTGDEFAECWLERVPCIDPAKQYRTRGGREVRIYAVDGSKLNGCTVHGAIKTDHGWDHHAWSEDGKNSCYGASNDLIEVPPAPKEYEVHVNIYSTPRGIRSTVWPTREEADKFTRDRIACVHLIPRHGEGL